MAASRPAVDAEFVLHAEDVGIVEVQEIRGATIGIEIVLHRHPTGDGTFRVRKAGLRDLPLPLGRGYEK
ncbi:MAG: hypothetical protein R3F19_30400 [Verrucomicrobiales bacterium]